MSVKNRTGPDHATIPEETLEKIREALIKYAAAIEIKPGDMNDEEAWLRKAAEILSPSEFLDFFENFDIRATHKFHVFLSVRIHKKRVRETDILFAQRNQVIRTLFDAGHSDRDIGEFVKLGPSRVKQLRLTMGLKRRQ